MKIPNDSLNRQWVDASNVNPDRVDELKPTLVSFLGFDRSKNPSLAGTGFVIAGNEQRAVVLTAKHVIIDGIKSIQTPVSRSASSALFVPRGSKTPTLLPKYLKAVWVGHETASLLNVVYVFCSDRLDIACCVVMPQEHDQFSPVSTPLDLQSLSIGDLVHMVSIYKMNVLESVPPREKDELGQIIKIAQAVNIRIGHVTGIYKKGLRQYQWPCFTTSIPAEPGMSGGFVCLPKAGTTVAACGVISADNSDKESMKNMLLPGESVVALTWPALGLRLPENIPLLEDTNKVTIYNMIKTGRMRAAIGELNQFKIVNLGGDDCRVHYGT